MQRIIGTFIAGAFLTLATAGCSASVSSRPAGSVALPTATTASASTAPARTTAAPKLPPGLASHNGWTLTTFTASSTYGLWTAKARLRNDTGDTVKSALFTVTYLSPSGDITHSFSGAANGVAAGASATVQFIGGSENVKGKPAGTPQFQVDLSS
jgi:hypothetical protein